MAFSVPYDFQPDTPALARQVDANFQAIIDALNNGGGGSLVPAKGHIILPGNLIVQWGTISGVAADGSAASAETFDIPFPNGLFALPLCQVSNNYQTNGWALSAPQTKAETATGFSVSLAGAPLNSTATVGYIAIGN